MRTHTLLTRVACSAVCFGVLLSGPVMAGARGIIKDIQLSADGTLYGQVAAPEGRPISEAIVQLKYQGSPIAATKSNTDGRFAISGVRGGAHEVVIGALRTPVRLWARGTAPKGAKPGLVIVSKNTVVRGQDYDQNGNPIYHKSNMANCGPTGFGLLDVITLGTLGLGGGALAVALDNQNEIDKLKAAIPASP
ncbi:MAG: carboxypeptidase regulatory-like domain-containing protein [Fuerstiella sp.]|nr:carboxypeptidase regulatory-like domain-containing protein [Fuerstiella sp.]MCP4510863.1 carboxypeptidase regulatory-like domain-containing protein [Fuerstiella sp.]